MSLGGRSIPLLENSRFMRKRRFLLFSFYLIILSLLIQCRRYDPVNDRIYEIPNLNARLNNIRIEALNDAIERYPDRPEAYFKLGKYYYQKGAYDSARSFLEQAYVLDSNLHAHNFALAQEYHQLGESQLAYEKILRAEKLKKNHLETLILSGELHYTQKDYDQAIKILNRALRIADFEPRIYYWKGMITMARLDSSNAKKYFELALHYRPRYVQAYDGLSELFLRFDQNRTAINYANQGLKIDSSYALLHFHKGKAFQNRLFFKDSAFYHFQKASRFDPSLSAANLEVGRYLFDKRSYEQASAALEKVLIYDAEQPEANYFLGVCYRRLGRRSAARDKLIKAIALDPNNFLARDLLQQIDSEVERERIRARNDSIQRAYLQQLEEQRKKMLARQDSIRKAYAAYLEEQKRKADSIREAYQRQLQEQKND